MIPNIGINYATIIRNIPLKNLDRENKTPPI